MSASDPGESQWVSRAKAAAMMGEKIRHLDGLVADRVVATKPGSRFEEFKYSSVDIERWLATEEEVRVPYNGEEMVTFGEVLRRLSIDEDKLRRLISEGEIRAFRDPKDRSRETAYTKMQFRRADVDNLQIPDDMKEEHPGVIDLSAKDSGQVGSDTGELSDEDFLLADADFPSCRDDMVSIEGAVSGDELVSDEAPNPVAEQVAESIELMSATEFAAAFSSAPASELEVSEPEDSPTVPFASRVWAFWGRARTAWTKFRRHVGANAAKGWQAARASRDSWIGTAEKVGILVIMLLTVAVGYVALSHMDFGPVAQEQPKPAEVVPVVVAPVPPKKVVPLRAGWEALSRLGQETSKTEEVVSVPEKKVIPPRPGWEVLSDLK